MGTQPTSELGEVAFSKEGVYVMVGEVSSIPSWKATAIHACNCVRNELGGQGVAGKFSG